MPRKSSKKTPKKTPKKQIARGGSKQRYGKVRPEKKGNETVVEDTSVHAKRLIAASVAASTKKTYTSAINTILAFTKKKNCLDVTKQDFFAFLAACADGGSTSVETFRSALLKEQTAAAAIAGGVPWARDPDVIAAAKGARRLADMQSAKVHKGCMTMQQFGALLALDEKRLHITPCRHCEDFFLPRRFVEAVKKLTHLQLESRLRPGELELLRADAFVKKRVLVGQGAGQQTLDVAEFVFPTGRKNARAGDGFLQSAAVEPIWLEVLALRKDQKSLYVAPRCADVHVGQLVGEAAAVLGWSTQVVWTAHAVKHSALTGLEEGIHQAVTKFTAGVVANTFQVYTKHSHKSQ